MQVLLTWYPTGNARKRTKFRQTNASFFRPEGTKNMIIGCIDQDETSKLEEDSLKKGSQSQTNEEAKDRCDANKSQTRF